MVVKENDKVLKCYHAGPKHGCSEVYGVEIVLLGGAEAGEGTGAVKFCLLTLQRGSLLRSSWGCCAGGAVELETFL